MTISEAKREARRYDHTLRVVDGEVQVKPREAGWDSASVYYTNDLEDAVGTARLSAERGHLPAGWKRGGGR